MDQLVSRFVNEFTLPLHNSVLIFAIILLIILLSPILLRKLKVPGIIMLIISGIIVGPQGFNLIERNEAVILFSTIGLLYIMFLAGIELELSEFIQTKVKSLTFGFFTFVIPLILGFPACYYILHLDFLSSLLTASMFSTHTLIAYPIVSKMGISKNEAVLVTVGGTIITDTAVLIILALINGVHTGSNTVGFWVQTMLSFSFFFLIMFYIVPRVGRWILKKVENERYSHFIFVLSIVFLSAFLAELSGLEAIIGAFMAGVALNRLVPKTSPLMSRLEFTGNSIFIPFFLISVGMIINLESVFSEKMVMFTALVLLVVAIFSKWLAAFITTKVLSFSSLQGKLIFGLSSSHAVATLAVITVGYESGILNKAVLNGTIFLILVSCMVATFVTENAAHQLAINKVPEIKPDDHAVANTRILVPVSNPATMKQLADLALQLSTHNKQTPVYVMSVVNDKFNAQVKIGEARKLLDGLIKHGSETDRKVEVVVTLDQNIANGIRRVIHEVAATDLVIGSSPHQKFSDLIFGNLVQHIINSTNQQIFTLKQNSSLFIHNSIRVICPAYCDKETGFQEWLHKVLTLSRNLNTSCSFYADSDVINSISQSLKLVKATGKVACNRIEKIEDMDDFIHSFKETDLIVFIQARKGSVSYSSDFKAFLEKVEGALTQNSLLIIFPRHLHQIRY